MTLEEIDKLIWANINQAENWEFPENSDGYSEYEVYDTARKVIKQLISQENEWKNLYAEELSVGIGMYKEKADKWDKLENAINDSCQESSDGEPRSAQANRIEKVVIDQMFNIKSRDNE